MEGSTKISTSFPNPESRSAEQFFLPPSCSVDCNSSSYTESGEEDQPFGMTVSCVLGTSKEHETGLPVFKLWFAEAEVGILVASCLTTLRLSGDS